MQTLKKLCNNFFLHKQLHPNIALRKGGGNITHNKENRKKEKKKTIIHHQVRTRTTRTIPMTRTLPWQRRPNCLAWAKVIWSGGRSKATPRGRANSFPPHRLRVASGSNGSACPTSLCRRLSPPRWNPSHKDWRHIIGRGRNWGSECSDVCCCFHCAHMYPLWNFFDLCPSLPYFQILPILISHVLSYFFNFLP